jgi:predicted nuclease of predicted toxin-antitoxin system
VSIRLQADADLNFDIVKAVRQQEAAIDFASAADSQLRGIKDPELLERAAVANRVLVSHDREPCSITSEPAWRLENRVPVC